MENKKYAFPMAAVLIILFSLVIEMAFSALSYKSVLFGTKDPVSFEMIVNNAQGFSLSISKDMQVQKDLNGQMLLQVPKSGGTLCIRGNLSELHSIAFDAFTASQSKDQLAKCTVSVISKDTPQTLSQILTYQFAVANDKPHTQMLLSKHENITEIQIAFASSKSDYTITGFGINNATPRLFSFSRFILVLLVVSIVFLCMIAKVWNVFYDEKNACHRYTLVICEVFCILFSFYVYFALENTSVKTDIEYPLKNVANEQCYVQQFDAFKKKQLFLDVEVSDELLALENPYDKGQRDGVSYLWDRAYYDGKYYSYFGAAPVFVVYYPYHFFFHKLPGAAKVMLFYTILGIVAFYAVIRRLLRVWDIKANILLLTLGSVTAIFASGLFLMLRGWSSVYYIASLAGLSSSLVFIWACLAAYEAKGVRKSLGLFCLAGFLLLVAVGSRVNHALMGILFVTPLFIHYLRQNRPLETKLNAVLYFMVPAILGAGLVMIYNGARFGSPFEFGSSYQLTVSDVRQNHMGFDRIIPALFHYFLQPAKITTEFPGVQFLYQRLNDYGYYVYVDTNMGVFCFPLVILSFSAVFLFFFGKKDTDVERFRHRNFLMILLMSIFVAILNFSIGGVHYRYTYDFCGFLALLGLFSGMEYYSYVSPSCVTAKKGLLCGFVIVFLATIYVAFSLLVNEYNGNFVSYSPSVWAGLRDFFMWR